MTPTEKVLTALQARECHPRPCGDGWSARCPAHEDRRASLSIGEGQDGRALLKCHAGCSVDAVCAAISMSVADLMPARDEFFRATGKPKMNGKRTIIATYDYRDESGELLFQVVRYDPKDFRQRRPKGGGEWDWSVKGVRVIPYHLRELLAEPDRPVFAAEGEKDVDNLARLGILGTCNAGGAGNWTAEHAEYLRGRHVVVLPDNDEAGRTHARQVAVTLQGVAASLRIVDLPDLPPKGDVSDWIAAGGTKDKLHRLADTTPEWTPATGNLPWPEIISLDDLELPAFPTHVLPDVLREWVEAESHATQTPADLAGLLALAVCSAMIARRVEVEPRPGWREPVNLFVAVLLEPGNRKSKVFADAMLPLKDRETELIEAARSTIAREQSDRRQAEVRLKKLEKTAGEGDDPEASRQASELAAALAEKAAPVLPRLIVDDATSEKLGEMLAAQGGRLASMSPEGCVFDLMKGLYSKAGIPQFDVYLKGHSGDDLITDRVSRESVRVLRPALTCGYSIQPTIIRGLRQNPAFRGRGLLARFLYAAPGSWIGQRETDPVPVSDATHEAYRRTVRSLAGTDVEIVLRLAPDACATLRQWEVEIETMLGDGGQMEAMRDWGGKLAGATLRLAAVLHCVEHGPAGSIGGPTIAAAVEIARYLIPHAEAVLNMMEAKEGSGDDDARYVLRWIERHKRQDFTKRDVHQHGKRRFPKADDLDPALGELSRRGYVREWTSHSAGPGRPPSPTYEVNPAVFASEDTEKRPHNSHNPAMGADAGNSGNIGSAFPHSDDEPHIRVSL